MDTWGSTLWDQRDTLETYTNNSITFFDKCASFIKERIGIEEEYARSLHRLVKQYQCKKKEDTTFTYQQCFRKFLQEHSNFACQREAISIQMRNNILNEMETISSESKSERKKTFRKLTESKEQIEQFRKALMAKKKKFNEASKECAKAFSVHETATKRLYMTKSQFVKLEKYSRTKRLLVEKARKEYESSIDCFNDKQKVHYEVELPNIINNELQAQEEKRSIQMSNFLQEYVTVQRRLFPALSRSVAGMMEAADLCDPGKDSMTLIKLYGTGLPHPKSINIDDLNKGWTSCPIFEKTKTGKCMWPKKKDMSYYTVYPSKIELAFKDDIANDYAYLPSDERRRKFDEEVCTLNHRLCQLEKAKEALVKLKEATEVSGGDIIIIEEEMEANDLDIERSLSLRHQYQNYISLLSDDIPNLINYDQEFCQASDSQCCTPISDITSSEELSEELQYQPASITQYLSEEFDNELWYIVLYDFLEQNQEEVTVQTGDVVLLLDEDYGSGWSRVARGNEEGYIPTSYIQLI